MHQMYNIYLYNNNVSLNYILFIEPNTIVIDIFIRLPINVRYIHWSKISYINTGDRTWIF